eukprot:CAMPEP_0178598616 /NCGR_PEP_ID=MMETSP0697-20121206/32845_1 /TAXON_ID=265572 /ORGANISM="Extubocellulus spinifer, Strain CCMP396" /LENGTH=249 /DNA_ID=CAMNT_0020236411 /DNA_START=18 /DNA_END=767 /DNA_ORIENTATION=-
MTKIVFACKSNSCRSQMAEGWAKDWLKRQKELLEKAESFSSKDHADCSCSLAEETGSDSLLRRLESKEDIERRRSILDRVVVTSVALDSSSVFKCETGACCGDTCETPSQRKEVKSKAVAAMKEDGVDISNSRPKTLQEILPILSKSTENETNAVDDVSAVYSSTLFVSKIEGGQGQGEKKVVDRLIVLCSCGNDIKRKLVRRSKSVEEWDIDAPTAASKVGEGDGAYRRVSLEIRNEVNILMDSLLGF